MSCCDFTDELIRNEMLEQIDSFNEMIMANVTNSLYVDNNLPNPSTFVPMYSYDYAIEDKKLKKMKKSFIKVYNWYSLEKYKEAV